MSRDELPALDGWFDRNPTAALVGCAAAPAAGSRSRSSAEVVAMTDDAKLTFTTLALRRAAAVRATSRLAPVVVAEHHRVRQPRIARAIELPLALSELPDEARPTTVARLLLPDGVRARDDRGRARPHRALPGRLGRRIPSDASPSSSCRSRAPTPARPAGHWVFVPVLEHACYVDAQARISRRALAAELAVLPAALALDLDGWRRLITYAPAELEPIEVELATTPLAEAQGRKALADAERKRLALATLDGAGRRLEPPSRRSRSSAATSSLAELTRVLDGRARRSVLLVGDEAVGKSRARRGVGRRATRRAPMWATSASELVAGASGLGEWQERVAAVLAAAETLDAILYFDDFGALFADRPAEGGIELGAAMRRHVVDGRVRVIGELTAVALDRAERRDVSLIGAMLRDRRAADRSGDDDRRVSRVGRALGEARSRTARRSRRRRCPTAVELARRYLPYRAFPGKAVRLLEELRVAHDAGRDARGAGPVLGEPELYAAFSWATGIPIALLADDQAARARRRHRARCAAAWSARTPRCAASPRRSASRRRASQPADKPLASLLFVGPTGVGKTELARSVAAYLFGAPDRMVRLDMSEYTDPWAAERLFGGGERRGPADRGGAQPAVRRRAARRDREGAPVGVRSAPAGARRGAADRRPRPHDVLPQRDHRADLEPRHAQRARHARPRARADADRAIATSAAIATPCSPRSGPS